MLRLLALSLTLGISALIAPRSNAQFNDCATSGENNATFAIQQANLNGSLLPNGSQIAIYGGTNDQCGGVGTWNGGTVVIAVWEDDGNGNGGLEVGEALVFKVWDTTTTQEDVSVDYASGPHINCDTDAPGTYRSNALCTISSVEVTAIPPPPSAPTLSSPSNGATGVPVDPTLTWNAVSDADSYHLQLTLITDSLFATPLVDDSTLTAVFYDVAGLEHETPYRWRVRAGNAGGSSPWASPFVFTTEQAPVNQPPVVTITAPADSSGFNQGDPVTFTGTATDPEDGDISTNISWSSNLYGNLGTGTSITMSTLNAGTHTITASVTDSLGAPGSDQISVTINGPGATDLHVENIATGTQSAGGRRNQGTATVTIFDDQGNPVAGALVQGTFSGSINETASGTTGAGGTVTLVTNGTTKSRNPNINFCVDDVTGALPYDPNDNGDTTFACSGGGDPTDVHIENIATGKQGAGGGQKRGTATVTIFDDLGNPAAGYTVTGTFSGDFNEAGVSGTTGADGTVTLTTQGTKSGKVNVDFCVDTVTGALPYDPSDNTSSAFACAAAKHDVTAAAAGDVPEDYALEQNYPNPFNPTTIIAYALPEAGPVTLKVYNVLGQEVATLVDSYKESGRNQVAFDAMRLSAGVYLYVIEAGRFRATRRMTLLK